MISQKKFKTFFTHSQNIKIQPFGAEMLIFSNNCENTFLMLINAGKNSLIVALLTDMS